MVVKCNEEVKSYFYRSADGLYRCKSCNKTEKYRPNMRYHVESKHYSPGYSCHICGKTFQTYGSVKRHEKICQLESA